MKAKREYRGKRNDQWDETKQWNDEEELQWSEMRSWKAATTTTVQPSPLYWECLFFSLFRRNLVCRWVVSCLSDSMLVLLSFSAPTRFFARCLPRAWVLTISQWGSILNSHMIIQRDSALLFEYDFMLVSHCANTEFTPGKNIKSLKMHSKWFQSVTLVIRKPNKVVEAYSLTTLGARAIRSCQKCSNMQMRLSHQVKI